MTQRVYGSLTRIADLETRTYELAPLERSHWATGDYVEGEVVAPLRDLFRIEDATGEMVSIEPGDRVIGAFGHRAATLEGVGSWQDIVGDRMQCLTSAGLFGAFTSVSTFFPSPIGLAYRGHVLRNGDKVGMADFALAPNGKPFDVPTVLLVGTSMSAGKTTTGRLVCEELSRMDYRVTGAKLTGAGRYRDILSFRDGGASEIYDFVDVGLPSTVLPEPEFRARIRTLLRHIALRAPDFLVAEAGASPLEPYNGAAAIAELGERVRCTILCASDPYAVLGVQYAFGLQPDLVAGPATSTTAAIELVRKLTGVPGINVLDPDARPAFRRFLSEVLSLAPP